MPEVSSQKMSVDIRWSQVHSSPVFHGIRLPRTAVENCILFVEICCAEYWEFLVLVKYCHVALTVNIMPGMVYSHVCSHSQNCTRLTSSPGRFCTLWSDSDKNINREKFCMPVSVQNQSAWKFCHTCTHIAAKFKRQKLLCQTENCVFWFKGSIFECNCRETVLFSLPFTYKISLKSELFEKRI
jgi:hypothetical protein